MSQTNKIERRPIRNGWDTFVRVWNRRRKQNSLIVVLLTGLFVWGVTELAGVFMDVGGLPERLTVLSLIAASGLILLVLNLRETWTEAKVSSSVPEISSRTACRLVDSTELINKLIQFDDHTYGEHTLPEQEARRIYARNGKCALALVDCEDNTLLGAIEFWPVTEEVAAKMCRGELSESALTQQHVLTETDLDRAAALYVSSFAVRDPKTPRGARNGATLLRCARRFIRQTYFSGDRKAIMLFALGWSRDGEGAAERLNFVHVGEFEAFDKITKVYQRVLSREDLEHWYDFDG